VDLMTGSAAGRRDATAASVRRVALLGLGEAGRRLAADLETAGVDLRGFDPRADDVRIAGRARDLESAVAGCDVVLSVNAAKVAVEVAAATIPALPDGAIYADLNTASPELKQRLAALTADTNVRFADVALLGAVPARGLGTPALASGEGARAFADAFGPLGMPVEVVSERAGDAAALKLLRSVFMKGLAASAVESLQAAEAAGHSEWLRRELAEVVGEPLLDRLLEGSRRHAVRRVDEMEAARDLLLELGIEPRIASASASVLAGLAASEPSANSGIG
jgi:3-hydroxyisobutyrate dehydrogenase-like beta-hydroxyacid dehydrogenase